MKGTKNTWDVCNPTFFLMMSHGLVTLIEESWIGDFILKGIKFVMPLDGMSEGFCSEICIIVWVGVV